MATFAALLRGNGFLIKGGLPVGRFLPFVVNLFMAGLAGLCANVLRGIGSRIHRRRRGALATLRGGLASSDDDEE